MRGPRLAPGSTLVVTVVCPWRMARVPGDTGATRVHGLTSASFAIARPLP